MGRQLPQTCMHGEYLDWGDFGDEWSPYDGLCNECVPPMNRVLHTEEYRLMNRHWLEEFHADWFADYDEAAKLEKDCDGIS